MPQGTRRREANGRAADRRTGTTPTRGRAVTRRALLQHASGLLAASAVSGATLARAGQRDARDRIGDVTGPLARYMAAAGDRPLPPEIVRETRHRLLDTLAAMLSGSRLKPGELAIKFARAQGGAPEATVLTAGLRVSAVNAAMANAMFAHADETDDADPVTKSHPGASTVPAALAVGERDNRSGSELLRAVALGYDVSVRWLMALGPAHLRATHRSAEGIGATFGAAAAAASMARLDEMGMRYALSYAAQQVSGVWSWERDLEHVEKAFDFAGMGARNGVTAALMAQMGFTGVPDVLDGEHNALEAHSAEPRGSALLEGLGSRFFVAETTIKTYSVGLPVQAPLDAFFSLKRQHRFTPATVERIVVRLPEDGAAVVNDRAMPDVNCQYLMAVSLLDGALTFEASHSYERMKDPQVLVIKSRVELIGDRGLMDPAAPRSGRVDVHLRDGRVVSEFTRFAPGSKERPLGTAEVAAKARELMLPVLGQARTSEVIDRVGRLEDVGSVRELTALLV